MIKNLQYLRAFAAINVVYFHTLLASQSYGKSVSIFSIIGTWGQNGVDIFFVLSGFVMIHTQIQNPKKIHEFYFSRLNKPFKISNKLKGHNVHNQERIDTLLINLDGTRQKTNLGANAMLAVSMAAKKLSAKIRKLPLYKTFFIKKNFQLPYPLMNIINGGSHANNGLRIQEFMIRPDKAKSFSEAMRICFIVITNLRNLLINLRLF